MRWRRWTVWFLAFVAVFELGRVFSGNPKNRSEAAEGGVAIKGWQKGKGWGWIWGPQDEIGSLNAMTAETIQSALRLAKQGKVYDLGVPYDRNSFKWPGHSPGEVLTFRSPEGVKRQGDFKGAVDATINPQRTSWHSSALFINDNVATQIDGLGHIATGDDNHWYNGFKEADWGGNFGIRKCDAVSIPPIVTRGVMIDVAGARGVEALPAHYKITIEDLRAALEKQKTELRPGDTVLIRTGAMRYWGENGADHDKLRIHDSAGIILPTARWLVEEKGAILIGSDTSGLELTPAPTDKDAGFIPVHRYLLIDQGVHIGEFHFLEDLAREKVYEFCYLCTTNKIRGTVAGFTLRPIAIR